MVGQRVDKAQKTVIFLQVKILALQFSHFIKDLVQSLFRVKNSRFIHVIPEAFDPLIQKIFVMQSKPPSGFGVQHIREMRFSRPYGAYKRRAVFFFAEISLLHAFLIDGISLLHLYSGIDDRNQMDALFFQIIYQSRKIRESFPGNGKVFVAFHIVDVHVNGVQREPVLCVGFGHFPEVRFVR